MRKHAVPVIVAVTLGLPLLYFGAYWAALDHDARDLLHISLSGKYRPGLWGEMPSDEYVVGGEAAKLFFGPANKVDRRWRPRHWLGDFADALGPDGELD